MASVKAGAVFGSPCPSIIRYCACGTSTIRNSPCFARYASRVRSKSVFSAIGRASPHVGSDRPHDQGRRTEGFVAPGSAQIARSQTPSSSMSAIGEPRRPHSSSRALRSARIPAISAPVKVRCCVASATMPEIVRPGSSEESGRRLPATWEMVDRAVCRHARNAGPRADRDQSVARQRRAPHHHRAPTRVASCLSRRQGRDDGCYSLRSR